LAIALAAVLTCGSPTDTLANAKHHAHTSHLPSWHAERDFGYGWGWDPTSVGYYVGPIWGRHRKGYFRCFDPIYGWHSCDRYVLVPHRWLGPWPDRSWPNKLTRHTLDLHRKSERLNHAIACCAESSLFSFSTFFQNASEVARGLG